MRHGVFGLWGFCRIENLCDRQNNDHCDTYWSLCYGLEISCRRIGLVGKNNACGREGLIDCIYFFVT